MPRALAVLMLATLAACGSEPTGPAQDPATAWSVSPTSVSLAVGESVEIQITFLNGSEVLDIRRITGVPRRTLISDCGWTFPCAVTLSDMTPAPDYRSYRFTVTGESPATVQLHLAYGRLLAGDCLDPPICWIRELTWLPLEYLPPLLLDVEVH